MPSPFQVREAMCAAVQDSNNMLSTLINEWLVTAGPSALFKNCANCSHMDPNGAPPRCTKFNATPPASVIVAGCPEHVDAEDIPF